MVKKTKTKEVDEIKEVIAIAALKALEKEVNKPEIKWYTTLATLIVLGLAVYGLVHLVSLLF